MFKNKRNWSHFLWDTWCVCSIVGIWPRFIEPNLLSLTKINLPISHLPDDLVNLKILQFSDLHWNEQLSDFYINKLIRKINQVEADIIVFTGDLINRSKLVNQKKLIDFLSSLRAKIGCFAVLGNHDYSSFVTLGHDGHYTIEEQDASSNISKGFKRLLNFTKPVGMYHPSVKKIKFNDELLQIYKETPFRVLHNETIQVKVKNQYLNITGLGEHLLDQVDVKNGFKNYIPAYPGLVLVHNPDAISKLKDQPGQLFLCGHTHGGQINLPWFNRRISYSENFEYQRGLIKRGDSWVYINRGVGSVMKFRWFSIPELTLFNLIMDSNHE